MTTTQVWTEGVCEDGAAILRDGVMVPIKKVLEALNAAAANGELYLVWSHEHDAWWGPHGNGYMRSLSDAGRYSHAEALHICTRAMPGTAQDLGALPELPVRETDVLTMRDRFRAMFPNIPAERWE